MDQAKLAKMQASSRIGMWKYHEETEDVGKRRELGSKKDETTISENIQLI